MAIESLLERGRLSDWREFANALSKSERLAADTLRVCEYAEDRRSAALARFLAISCYPGLRGYRGDSNDCDERDQEPGM
jgi:hypothetical protein